MAYGDTPVPSKCADGTIMCQPNSDGKGGSAITITAHYGLISSTTSDGAVDIKSFPDELSIGVTSGDQLEVKDKGITFAKIQDIPSGKLLGRSSSGDGSVEIVEEEDPIALAKTITIEQGDGITIVGGTQTINSNPSFTVSAKTDTSIWNPSSGSEYYIHNQLTPQANADFNIDGKGVVGETLTIGTGLTVTTGTTSITGDIILTTTASGGIELNFNGGNTTGDVFYRTSLGTLAPLHPGINGQVLTLEAGIPAWKSGVAGTVTSVGVSVPSSIMNVTGSPVTNTGIMAISFVAQSANTVFAGPSSGAGALPTFRTLTATDIPSLTASKITDFTTAARASFSSGTGISIVGGVITNTSPDQTVALTAGTNITITGTYPNFTITAAGGGSGSVTSVGLTSADITVGGTSPITTSGTYTLTLKNVNANVGTFNNVTVNAKGQVTAASTVGYLTSFTETDPVAIAKIVTVTGTTPITVTGGAQTLGANPSFAITHAVSGVAANTYNNVTVNTFGHVTAGSNVAYLTTETDPVVSARTITLTAGTGVTITGGTQSLAASRTWTIANSASLQNTTDIGNTTNHTLVSTNAEGLRIANDNAKIYSYDTVNSSPLAYIEMSNTKSSFMNVTGNPIIFGTSGTEKMRLTNTGTLGIGTNNPQAYLDVRGSGIIATSYGSLVGTDLILEVPSGRKAEVIGNMTIDNNLNVGGTIISAGGGQNSDIRFKNILATNGEIDTNLANNIDVIKYRWKDRDDQEVHYGYSAQQIDKILPSAVYKPDNETEKWAVNYLEVHSLLIKELTERIQKLESK